MPARILCIGEILWDALPAGLFLGGAPFNVARHLHRLGERVTVASRVGDDRLGDEARRRVAARGLDTALLQTDRRRPTGVVRVALTDESGDPDYEILKPAAWDALALTTSLQEHVETTDVLVFGSLAQRAPTARRTIQHLYRADVLGVFDVNLRPPHVDRTVVKQSLEAARLVKANRDELCRLQEWFDLPADETAGMTELAEAFGCDAVCITAGSDGARLWAEGHHWHHPGYAVEESDPVGAGDAFLAALLAGRLAGGDEPVVLDRARHCLRKNPLGP